MDVVSFGSAVDFRTEAFPFLELHEVENNVLIGIANRIAAGGRGGHRVTGEAPGFWLIRDGDSAVGAALITPPYDLVLGTCRPGAARALGERLSKDGCAPPGVVGPSESADEFATAWLDATGSGATLFRRERLYTLTEVTPPRCVRGSMRAATDADVALVERWLGGFMAEVGEEEVDAATAAAVVVADGRMFLWLDPEPVALAGWARWLTSGVAIAPVYTPPELRGRGYASALTAALSQQLLDAGRTFCCLYADVANEVSNHIYERIGYRRVLDANHYRFGRPLTRQPAPLDDVSSLIV